MSVPDLPARVHADAAGVPNCVTCDGGCLEACVASVTGVDPAEIPCVEEARENVGEDDSWLNVLNRALKPHGWLVTWTHADRGVPEGWAIAAGPAGDEPEEDHAVVTYDGRTVHDPTGCGLAERKHWYLLIPLVTEVA